MPSRPRFDSARRRFSPFLMCLGIALQISNPPPARGRDATAGELTDADAQRLMATKGTEGERAKLISTLARRSGVRRRPEICNELLSFARDQESRTTRAPAGTADALRYAFRTMGLACDKTAVPYLAKWAQADLFIKNVTTSTFDGGTNDNQQSLQVAAIWGLGMSGDADALKVLKRLQSTTPEGPQHRKIRGVLESAIETNVELGALGAEKYFSEAEEEKRKKRIEERLKPILDERARRRKERQTKK